LTKKQLEDEQTRAEEERRQKEEALRREEAMKEQLQQALERLRSAGLDVEKDVSGCP